MLKLALVIAVLFTISCKTGTSSCQDIPVKDITCPPDQSFDLAQAKIQNQNLREINEKVVIQNNALHEQIAECKSESYEMCMHCSARLEDNRPQVATITETSGPEACMGRGMVVLVKHDAKVKAAYLQVLNQDGTRLISDALRLDQPGQNVFLANEDCLVAVQSCRGNSCVITTQKLSNIELTCNGGPQQ